MHNLYNSEKLRIISVKKLTEQGLTNAEASIIVDAMLSSDRAGISTHGIRMLPAYIDKLKSGSLRIGKPEIINSTNVFTVIDANAIIGYLSAYKCSEVAVEKAKENGIHTVFARNCNTFGAASYYSNLIANENLIGIVFSNSPAAMPVANGAEPMLGTNPIAFSCPTRTYGPIIMDMATSIVAKSRLEINKQEGKPIPDGWALDSDGKPTNDPLEGIKGLIMPMAGFKGYEIAMMIDILSGVLSGAGFLNRVNKFYSSDNKPMNVGQVFIAIDPSKVYGDGFLSLMDDYVENIRKSTAISGERIIIPGDRRKSKEEAAKQNGISINKDSVNKLARILISGNATEIDFEKIFGEGYELVYQKDERKSVENPEDYDAVICNSLFLYNNIERFTNLRFIQLTSSGMDRVPLGYIETHGIYICNAKGVYDIPMAEYTIGRILEWYKKFRTNDLLISEKKWIKQRKLKELNNNTVIIYGYGSIGHEIAIRLKGFNTYMIGISRTPKQDSLIDEWVSINDASRYLKTADIVIFTLPLSKATRHIVNTEFIDNLKESCLLVNVSRGGIIDTEALIRALDSNRINGAILDVFEEEPLPVTSRLWQMDNVLLSPHNSFEGEGNKKRLETVVKKNLKCQLEGIVYK